MLIFYVKTFDQSYAWQVTYRLWTKRLHFIFRDSVQGRSAKKGRGEEFTGSRRGVFLSQKLPEVKVSKKFWVSRNARGGNYLLTKWKCLPAANLNIYDFNLNIYNSDLNIYDFNWNIYNFTLNIYDLNLNIYNSDLNIHNFTLNIYNITLNIYNFTLNIYNSNLLCISLNMAVYLFIFLNVAVYLPGFTNLFQERKLVETC